MTYIQTLVTGPSIAKLTSASQGLAHAWAVTAFSQKNQKNRNNLALLVK